MKNKVLENTIYIVGSIVIAFLILQVLGFGLKTKFPVVSVVSASMRHDNDHFSTWVADNNMSGTIKNWNYVHGLKEGDMIIIVGANQNNLHVGDIVVYNSPYFSEGPIIHRIIQIENGTYIIKGDNNLRQDPYPVTLDEIQGRAVFAVPDLGLPRYACQQLTICQDIVGIVPAAFRWITGR